MKKLLTLIILILTFTISTPVFASSIKNDKATLRSKNMNTGYGVYIDDYADYLSEDEENRLVKDMEPITHYGNVMFLSYTYEDECYGAIGADTEYYYLNNLGPYTSGIVFSVNPDDIYIYSEGKMYDIVDKKYAYTITDNIYTEAKDDNMYNCSAHCYQMIKDVLEGRRISQPMKYICNTLLGIMISILLCFLYIHYRSTMEGVNPAEMIKYSTKHFSYDSRETELLCTTKRYAPSSSSGGGSHGSHGGGHHGGGGGHHGGGGGHHR